MANNLPPLWRFDWGDYLSLGTAFQKFLANLNLFTLSIYNLVNGGIGFQNLQRTIYNITVTAGTTTPISFVNPLPIAPSGLSLVRVIIPGKTNTPITSSVCVGNFVYDGKTITILNIVGLVSGTTYQLSIEVM